MFPVTAIQKMLAAIDLRDHQLFAIDKLGKDIDGDPDEIMQQTIGKMIVEVYNRGHSDGERKVRNK